MTLARHIFGAVLTCLVAATAAAQTPVVLIQGLDETTGAVAGWYNALANAGYASQVISSLNSSSSIGAQTSAVGGFLSGSGYGTNTILVGHSQGGLVARYASRSTPLLGLVTVASPNAGADIAGFGSAQVGAMEGVASLDLWNINQGWGLDWGECNDCSSYWYDASTFFTDLASAAGLGLEVAVGVPFLISNPHLVDMAPESSTITNLMFNPGLELAADREAIAVDVIDYAAAPFRLVYPSPGDADAWAAAVQISASISFSTETRSTLPRLILTGVSVTTAVPWQMSATPWSILAIFSAILLSRLTTTSSVGCPMMV